MAEIFLFKIKTGTLAVTLVFIIQRPSVVTDTVQAIFTGKLVFCQGGYFLDSYDSVIRRVIKNTSLEVPGNLFYVRNGQATINEFCTIDC